MRLKGIKATNLLGASFEVALEPLTLIYGDNRSGKSRIRKAIELALLGYSPAVDKRAADIFNKFSSGKKMEVAAVLQERQKFNADSKEPVVFPSPQEVVIHRSWEMVGVGGTVKAKHHVPLG